MADHTQSIANDLRSFGGITDKWAAHNWGSFVWGEGTNDLPVDATHLVSETLTPLSAIYSYDRVWAIYESLGLDSGIYAWDREWSIYEALALLSDPSDEALGDGSGYYYVFPSNTINHETAAAASYTSGSTPSNTWTSGTAGADPWS